MNRKKIIDPKTRRHFRLLFFGLLFLFSFSRFYIHFKEFNDLDESFTCLFYSEPSSAQGLAKECLAQGIDCETFIAGLEKGMTLGIDCKTLTASQAEGMQQEEISHTNSSAHKLPASPRCPLAGPMAISTVRGMKTLDYRKTEHLFQNSDVRIDIILLKWLVYLIVFLFSLGILALFFAYSQKICKARWTCFFCLSLFLCYMKLGIFADTARFPVWALPGKWSDLEGFGALWENLLAQLSAISHFRDYPILCRYYQGLAGCPFYLVLCFLSFWAFLKNALPS